jgi:hypothetical protein
MLKNSLWHFTLLLLLLLTSVSDLHSRQKGSKPGDSQSTPSQSMSDKQKASGDAANPEPQVPPELSSASSPLTAQRSAPQSSSFKYLAILAFALAILTFLALAADLYLRRKKARDLEASGTETPERGICRLGIELARVNDALLKLEDSLKALSASQASREESLKVAISQNKQDIDNLPAQMNAMLKQALSTGLPKVLGPIEARLSEMGKLSEIVARHQEFLSALQSKSELGLHVFLRILAQQALLEPAASVPEGEVSLADRVDEAVSQFFRKSVPSRDGLSGFAQRCDGLAIALESFQEYLRRIAPDMADKLSASLIEARQLKNAIAGLMSEVDAKRLRLVFSIDFDTGSDDRQKLIDGIADGLKNEILKLGNATQFFERRLAQLSATAAAVASDLSDNKLDPTRTNAELQKLLASLFEAAGVEEIAPRRNDEFRAIDHSLLQIKPRSTPTDHSQAVAQLVSRGFRYRDRVIRKASVLVFE